MKERPVCVESQGMDVLSSFPDWQKECQRDEEKERWGAREGGKAKVRWR
jgi:hypothetical protein